jgi:hypothetical protein
MKFKQHLELWTLVAVCAVAAYVLMIRPIAGIADNGDFLRIMRSVGLDYLDPSMSYEDKYFGYFIREFKLVPLGIGGYASTQVVLVLIATLLNKLLYSSTVFDIRFMAVVYTALLCTAFYFFLRYNKMRSIWFNLVLAALLFFIFTDIGYIGYFNTLFGEPVSYVFLLLTTALGIALIRREQLSLTMLILFYVCIIFLVGSKVQNAPIGVLAALFSLRYLNFSPDRSWRRTVIGFSIFFLLGSMTLYLFAPKQLKEINLYQTVFYGVLKDSPTPEQDLKELGLPQELAVLANTNFFTPNTPIPQRDPILYEKFYNQMNHAKIAVFYLKHPGRLLDKLEIAAKNGMTIRPYYLGTYEKAEGKPRGAVSDKFGLWSEWKWTWLPNTFWFVFVFYLLYYAVLVWEYIRADSLRQKVFVELFGLIGLIGIVSFLIPIIGDGEADLAKHLFLFNVCFDMMLAASLLWIVSKLKVMERNRCKQ